MHIRQTKHQVARRAIVDFQRGDHAYVFKQVSELRLTYQVRALEELALREQIRIDIEVPERCKIAPELRAFVKASRSKLRIVRR